MRDAEGQKLCSITATGTEALGAWWDATPADEPPPRDELMLKVLMGIEQSGAHAMAVITHQRTVLLSLLQAKRRARAALDASLPAALVTNALVVRAQTPARDRHLHRLTHRDRGPHAFCVTTNPEFGVCGDTEPNPP